MTKINDLVTVTLNSAFATFTVREELYELRAAVLEHWSNRELAVSDQMLVVSRDVRIQTWIRTCEFLFTGAADAVVLCTNPKMDHRLTDEIRDLSDRYLAAVRLGNHHPRTFDPSTGRGEMKQRLITAAWRELTDRLYDGSADKSVVP